MKYRMEFSKKKEVAFVSHLELMKVFSQAIRRAKLPIAWTEGFNPRPKINFSSAIATGMTSLAECADMELNQFLEPDVIQQKLNDALPQGFEVHAIRFLEEKSKSLMALMAYADYHVEIKWLHRGEEQIDWSKMVEHFLAGPEILIQYESKGKKKTKDLRPGIVHMEAQKADEKLVLRMQLISGSTGNVRPEHVTEAFLSYVPCSAALSTRYEKTMTYGLKQQEKVRLFEV